MPKRYGITKDPKRRERELNSTFSGLKNFKVEKKFSSQKAAQNWENTKPNHHPGGSKTTGSVCGYSHTYTRRKPGK